MAGIHLFYRDLKKILAGEMTMYSDLQDLLRQKQQVVVANDLDGLQDIISAEQDLLQEIADTAAERDRVSTELARILNIRDRRITLTKIINRSNPQEAAELKEINARLKEHITAIQVLNFENQRLLNFAIYSIHELVSSIYGFDREKSGVYNLTGKIDTPRSESGIFNLQI